MRNNVSKKYLSTCGKIINKKKDDLYIIMNPSKDYNNNLRRLSQEDFDKLETKEIKTQIYAQMLNEFYRNVGKVKWKYNGNTFCKLPNFETDKNGNITNYSDLPAHKNDYGYCNLVYHWGEVFYMRTHNGRSYLINPYTNSFVKWTGIKNCAPIRNCDTKNII